MNNCSCIDAVFVLNGVIPINVVRGPILQIGDNMCGCPSSSANPTDPMLRSTVALSYRRRCVCEHQITFRAPEIFMLVHAASWESGSGVSAYWILLGAMIEIMANDSPSPFWLKQVLCCARF